MPDLLQSIGVTYKFDYNGKNSGTFYANENNATLTVSGSNGHNFSTYDPQDLLYDRARNVIPADKYNHFMVCGCAYIYGGSWGISWEKIMSRCCKTLQEKGYY